MTNDIFLIVVGINWNSGQFLSVSKEETWAPFATTLEADEEPEEAARRLFADEINLSPNWVNLTLRSAKRDPDDDTRMRLIYTCSIPLEETDVRGNAWIDVGNVPQANFFYEELTTAVRNFSA